MAPLSDLLKNESPKRILWTRACEEVFQTLNAWLPQEPILYSPDFAKEFLLQTDASNVGLGAVLSQVVGGVQHPILYISRELFPQEKTYLVIQKEALAVR